MNKHDRGHTSVATNAISSTDTPSDGLKYSGKSAASLLLSPQRKRVAMTREITGDKYGAPRLLGSGMDNSCILRALCALLSAGTGEFWSTR